MVFHNIFDTAQNASTTGKIAGDSGAGYIPKTPGESICVPPHDPSKPFTAGPQDPKIVRETAPQAQVVYDFVSALSLSLGVSAKQQDTTFSDPSTTVDTASPILTKADQVTRTYPQSTPEPGTPSNPKPK